MSLCLLPPFAALIVAANIFVQSRRPRQERQAALPVQRLQRVRALGPTQRVLRRGDQSRDPGRLPGARLPAGDEAHLRRRPNTVLGWLKKSAGTAAPRGPSPRPGALTSSNWTRSGRSSCGARTSAGCGWPSAAAPARSSPTPSAIEAKPPAACCGSASRSDTRSAVATPTSGRPMPVLPPERHRATGKGDGPDLPHRALQRRPAPAAGALCPADFLVLQERPDARELLAAVLARAQPADQASTEKAQTDLSHYQNNV